MNRAYESAERFCELVKSPSLVRYLHLEAGCSGEQAKQALSDRLAYLQTVQDLPEYRKEAMMLIRKKKAFEALLDNPDEYVKEIARRKVFKHLPEFRISVSEQLESGTLNSEGVAYLRRVATDLSITMELFEETLNQMCAKAGIERPQDGGISLSAPVGDFKSDDPYKILGASRHANIENLKESYKVNLAAARDLGDPVSSLQAISKVEAAWKTLSDRDKRRDLDDELLSYAVSETTAPSTRKLEPRRKKAITVEKKDPLRMRPRRPIGVAPKAANVLGGAKRAVHISVSLDQTHRIKVINKPITLTLTVKKTDGKPLFALISTDKGWLVAEKSELDQTLQTQTVKLSINPTELFQPQASCRVVLQLETGERISTTVEVEKVSWWSPRTNVPAFFGFVAMVGIGIFMLGTLIYEPKNSGQLSILVDPSSEVVLVNGIKQIPGSYIQVGNPPVGSLQLDVVQHNFAPYRLSFSLDEGETKNVIVRLQLASAMTFRPTAGMTRDKTVVADEAEIPIERMYDCLDKKTVPGDGENRIVIYLDKNGRSTGVEIEGPAAEDSVVKECLLRQAATVSYKPLTSGDYAVIAVYLE